MVTGQFNFYVDTQIKGQLAMQNSNISLSAFSHADKRIAIPCSFKWFRDRGVTSKQVTAVKGNTYQCSAKDVGCIIKAMVEPQDDEHKGTAVVQIGPIKIEPGLKNLLEGLLCKPPPRARPAGHRCLPG